ncbi:MULTISPECIES: fasciclin domain-containing protein [Methanoculleus]|uniref:Beta-Ig-H3/fasciclin n=2 Tax=Methanoculleus TaxID=45989 RepID=A3CWA3_METMJ|nr:MULTISPECIES: fasciclin domain-containing protein [Methanoculleus]ABN57653.1 beta-Ig-H3/fasciclin [Methanoculleus marisnigri JR1]MCC7556004.1 fasciclin domain-containing protein [Methanoculleus marisnigri]UYU19049.1 fasciclin domain-containing protein [Methanoculleus submarinus]
MAKIFDTLQNDGRFGRLVEIIQTLGEEKMLQGEGPMTFFAPVDSAWDAIPEPNRAMILNDKQMLSHLIDFFTIGNHKCTLESLLSKNVVQTVEGNTLMVRSTERGTQVDEAVVLEGDIEAENGIIHALDSVPFTTLSQAYEAYMAVSE